MRAAQRVGIDAEGSCPRHETPTTQAHCGERGGWSALRLPRGSARMRRSTWTVAPRSLRADQFSRSCIAVSPGHSRCGASSSVGSRRQDHRRSMTFSSSRMFPGQVYAASCCIVSFAPSSPPPDLRGISVDEVAHEQRNVFVRRAQRRQIDREDVAGDRTSRHGRPIGDGPLQVTVVAAITRTSPHRLRRPTGSNSCYCNTRSRRSCSSAEYRRSRRGRSYRPSASQAADAFLQAPVTHPSRATEQARFR